MSLIEGIGDEVLHFFVFVLVIAMAAIAWWSTNITDSPLFTTVLILERRTRTRNTNQANDSASSRQMTVSVADAGNGIDTGQGGGGQGMQEFAETQAQNLATVDGNKEDTDGQSTLVVGGNEEPTSASDVYEIVAEEEVGEDSSCEPVPQMVENSSATTEPSASDSSVLRRRRLAFFLSRGPTLIEPVAPSPAASEAETSAVPASEQQPQQPQPPDPNRATESEPQSEHSTTDNIRIRLKYLNDNQTVVEGRLQEQLGDFKRRHFSLELAAEKMVRLIFNGQVLHSDSQTLQGYGLFDNCVVHCLVHNQRSTPSRSSAANGGSGQVNGGRASAPPPDWNLGTVLYASLSIVLGFALYCRYQYSYLFTVTTTAALFGLSAIFAVTMVGQFLPDSENI